YSAIVTRNTAFDTEANDSFATAQPLASNSGALGGIYSGVVPSPLASTEGNSNVGAPFNIGSANTQRYQQLYSSLEFSQPGTITGLRFRRNGNNATFGDVTVNMKINLSYAATSFAA